MIGAGLAAMPMLPAGAQPSDPDPAASSPIKETPARDKLGQADRDLLAEAVADGDKTVTLILATKTGEAARRRGLGRGPRRHGRQARGPDRLRPRHRADQVRHQGRRPGRRAQGRPQQHHRAGRPERRPRPRGAVASAGSGRRAPRTTTRTCRPARPVRSRSRRATRRATAAASPSASSTPASTSTTRRCRRPRPASARSSTGSPRPTRCSTATAPGARCSPTSPARRSRYRRRHLDRAGGHLLDQPVHRGDHRGQRARRRRQPRRRHHRPFGVLYDPVDPRHLGRRRTRTSTSPTTP